MEQDAGRISGGRVALACRDFALGEPVYYLRCLSFDRRAITDDKRTVRLVFPVDLENRDWGWISISVSGRNATKVFGAKLPTEFVGLGTEISPPLTCIDEVRVSVQFVRGLPVTDVTGGAFPRKVGGENRTVTAGRRPWWPRMAGLQALSTRAFGPRLRRLTALTALATRPLIATKRSTARCGQSVCKCHAEKFRSAIFARILTAVHSRHVQALFDDGDEHVDGDRDPDLGFDGIFRGAEKSLDAQVLLDPFEEQLDTPYMLPLII